jgi:hypothetical protein
VPRADGLTAIARNMTFKKQLKFMGLRIGAFVADTVLRYDEKAEDASERKSLEHAGQSESLEHNESTQNPHQSR